MSDDLDLVTIFESGNAALLAIAKSILDGAEIPYMVKGEGLQNLFGMGQIGSGFNLITGPAEIQVNREDEFSARALLAEIDEEDNPDNGDM